MRVFLGPNLRPPSKASVENAPDHAEGMPGTRGEVCWPPETTLGYLCLHGV